MLTDHYTLIIPTYNRPALLSRLLDYLEREGAEFPVLVLDSSKDDVWRSNGERISRSRLTVRHAQYPPDIHPYLKIREGVGAITTPYCSVCADDDLIMLPALEKCLALLEQKQDACAAHGWYFNFAEGPSFDLSYVVYRGPSLLEDDPISRVREMLASYEVVFYAVYRTAVLHAVFERVDEFETVLGGELATAALTAVAGKVLRIEEFYYGRSLGESVSYENWHPHQVLVNSPALLLRDFQVLRDVVAEGLRRAPGQQLEGSTVKTVLDLMVLRYLSPFLRQDVLDLIITDRLKGLDARSTIEHLWDVFVTNRRAPHRIEPLTDLDGAGFTPALFKDGDRHTDYVFRTRTAWAVARTYIVFFEFLFPDLKPPLIVGRQKLLAMVDRLNSY